jgi:ubiquinone biosynthesis protein UbiJ
MSPKQVREFAEKVEQFADELAAQAHALALLAQRLQKQSPKEEK